MREGVENMLEDAGKILKSLGILRSDLGNMFGSSENMPEGIGITNRRLGNVSERSGNKIDNLRRLCSDERIISGRGHYAVYLSETRHASSIDTIFF